MLQIEDVIKSCISSSKSKRLTDLSYDDLLAIWSHIGSYIQNHIDNKKTIICPDFGTFVFNKKYYQQESVLSVAFIPSPTLDNALGIKSDKSIIQRAQMFHNCQSINFYAIATQCGILRDKIQMGLREILLQFQISLKSNHEIGLSIGSMMKLELRRGSLTCKVSKEYRRLPLDVKDTSVPSSLANQSLSSASSFEKEVLMEIAGPPLKERVILPPIQSTLPKNSEIEKRCEEEKPQQLRETSSSLTENQKDESSLDDSVEKEAVESQEEPEVEKEKEQTPPFTPPPAILANKHKHRYTGERLWTDGSCCICRQEKSKIVMKDDTTEEKLKTVLSSIHQWTDKTSGISLFSNDFAMKKEKTKMLEISPSGELTREIAEALHAPPVAAPWKVTKSPDIHDVRQYMTKEARKLQREYQDLIARRKGEEEARKGEEKKTSLEISLKIQQQLASEMAMNVDRSVQSRKSLEHFWKTQSKLRKLKASILK